MKERGISTAAETMLTQFFVTMAALHGEPSPYDTKVDGKKVRRNITVGELTYEDFPQHFKWNKSTKSWDHRPIETRMMARRITFIGMVPSKNKELLVKIIYICHIY